MLSSEKQRLYIRRLRELQRLGLSVPLEYTSTDTESSEVVMEQCELSLVFDLRNKGTLYLACLSVVAKRPGVCACYYQFEPPWADHDFQPLPAFAESSRGGAYVLPNNWDFPREDILNFNFGKTGWRIPCTRVVGVLCAVSATRIPTDYVHGAQIPVGVKLFNRSGRQLGQTTVILCAERWDERAVQRQTENLPLNPVKEVNPAASVHAFGSALYEGGPVRAMRERRKLSSRAESSPNLTGAVISPLERPPK